jgi:hypothetical protein
VFCVPRSGNVPARPLNVPRDLLVVCSDFGRDFVSEFSVQISRHAERLSTIPLLQPLHPLTNHARAPGSLCSADQRDRRGGQDLVFFRSVETSPSAGCAGEIAPKSPLVLPIDVADEENGSCWRGCLLGVASWEPCSWTVSKLTLEPGGTFARCRYCNFKLGDALPNRRHTTLGGTC